MRVSKERVDSIAIGRFDGFHLGHRELFKSLGENGAILMIHRDSPEYILPNEFAQQYINFPIFRYNLDEIKSLDGHLFLEKLFRDFPNLKKIVVGYDFFFGKGRGCSAFDLQKSCRCEVQIVDEVKLDEISIHSGEISKLLKSGDVRTANRFLGRAYSIIGRHIRGQGVGKESVVPTINISFTKFIAPKDGVYLTKTYLKNREYNSISFIGKRETTDGNFAFETHILEENIKENSFETVKVEFIEFIRENRRFESLKELRQGVMSDIKIAKKLLSVPSSSNN